MNKKENTMEKLKALWKEKPKAVIAIGVVIVLVLLGLIFGGDATNTATDMLNQSGN